MMRFAPTQLSHGDLVKVVDLIGSLHDATDANDVSTRLVGSLRELAQCDLVSYNDIDMDNPGTRTWFEPELVPRPELEAAFDALQHEHPLVRSYAETRDPGPRRMSDYISLADLRALDLWREVFRPLETNHQIAFAVLASSHRVIGLGLNRWSHDFEDRHLALIGVLQQHVTAAYHHANLRTAQRDLADRDQVELSVLTPREWEVLALIAAGRTSAQIAETLFISPRTAHKHAENIRVKLGVRTRAEAAARYAVVAPADDPGSAWPFES